MGKRLAIVIASVAAFLLAAFVVYRVLYSEPSAPAGPTASVSASAAPSASVAASGASTMRIVAKAVSGKVERELADGTWVPVKTGELLHVDDVLRTGAEGSLDLDFNGANVAVSANTQLALPQLAEAGGLRIDEGRVEASVPDDGRTFRVEVEGSDTAAETESGEFSVLAAKSAGTTVAAREGEVRVSAKNKTVTVKKGQLSVVRPDSAPSAARAIPASLFLKVKQPGGVQRSKRLEVSGRTTPGAIISINGVRMLAGADGTFKRTVALNEGKNKLSVTGVDVMGRTERAEMKVTVDSRPPAVGGKMQWGGG